MTSFLLYLFRWQLSSPILWCCLILLSERLGVFWATVLSNLAGGAVFFFVDRWIFRRYGKHDYKL